MRYHFCWHQLNEEIPEKDKHIILRNIPDGRYKSESALAVYIETKSVCLSSTNAFKKSSLVFRTLDDTIIEIDEYYNNTIWLYVDELDSILEFNNEFTIDGSVQSVSKTKDNLLRITVKSEDFISLIVPKDYNYNSIANLINESKPIIFNVKQSANNELKMIGYHVGYNYNEELPF